MMERNILHIDMDAFYAAIEQRDNPDLRGLPVIIGSRHPRSVVSTASYEARAFGVHSAMPMVKALKLCPEAICIPPNLKKYQNVSEKIMQIFNKYTDLVEALSLDEAFLDVSGSQRIFGNPRVIAQRIKENIKEQVGLTCSIGISYNKFLAKLASDLEKPNGMTVICKEDIKNKVWPLPINKMWGIGPKSSIKLEKCNIRTIGQLAQTDLNFLQNILGSWGAEVYHMANGIDNRPVVPHREAHSIGHETTFLEDTVDLEFIKMVLLDLAQETFLKVFKSIDKFRGESSFSTWIYRITANICKDELRKIKRKPQTSLDQEIWLDEGSVIRQVVDEKPTPDEAFEQKELWNYLQDLIANLSPEYRMVIVLRDINGYSYEEIAQITETSLGTVKSRLNRARKALSEQINLLKGGIK